LGRLSVWRIDMKNDLMEFNGSAIAEIEACIGYTFENKGLLRQAFTRSSYRNEHPRELDNEVLELIGDSVLSLSVLTYFRETYAEETPKGLATDWDEGRLSALKNALVNKRQLASRMERLGLQRFLLLGKGDRASEIWEEDSVKEDLFEGILGAVYVDSDKNFDMAYATVRRMLDIRQLVEQSASRVHLSYRNDLQEWCQHKKRRFATPTYCEEQTNDDEFVSTVQIPEIRLSAEGKGKNVKAARECAAKNLLADLSKYPEDAFYAPTVVIENFVGRLQEAVHRGKGDLSSIRYRTVDEETLPDGSFRFVVECNYAGTCVRGCGTSKKEAKQNAAREMLGKI